ncbi:MAG: sigma 54-interacting transcriptional regulator, partial [Novosphingobium sp.]
MSGPVFTETAKTEHAVLVQRAVSIAGTILGQAKILVRGASETSSPPPGFRVVCLEQGNKPGVFREGRNQTRVTMRDPSSEIALAQCLAAMAGPKDPLAADAESLAILALAERLAATDIPVLINGPTGTGKEVLSRFIHDRSDRQDGPFIAVNCAAMPESMLEAMLFGHQKGAFTGATQASEGFIRAADGGTLLLDEIAEMPLQLQAKLLRALQEQEVVPIGSTQPIKVNTRIIACANRDLPTEVAEGRFRADLYYRLNVFPLELKALSERPDDIAPLAFALAMRHAADESQVPCFTDAALALLKLHTWPGNVRELENVIRRALVLAQGRTIIDTTEIVFDPTVRLASGGAGADTVSA